MTSSTIDQIKLKAVLGCDSLRVLTKQGGGNSNVYCVEADGKKLAVKVYPPYAPNQRDRLASEKAVYEFLNHNHVPAVPMLKTYSVEDRWLIIDWIDGELPKEYLSTDIEQAVAFIDNITKLNTLPEAYTLPQAAEPCLSLDILLNQIKARYQRLYDVSENETELKHFLTKEFLHVFELAERAARLGYRELHMHYKDELAVEKRSLIPADFGFHNAIRDKVGRLHFFDFDYFGWDDPVKLLADLLWHPKTHFSQPEKQLFIQGFVRVFYSDTQFLPRFYFTWPLYGLRWTLILLNEFIPAFWQNRQHASVHQDQAVAKQTQLQRAKALLHAVQHDGCPYEITRTASVVL